MSTKSNLGQSVFSQFYLYALVPLFSEQQGEDIPRRGHEDMQIPEGIYISTLLTAIYEISGRMSLRSSMMQ